MSKYFNEKDIENFRQCFKLYAPEGFVNTHDKLGFIMRSLNLCPTVDELKDYFAKYKKEEGFVDFADFLNILHNHLLNEKASTEVLNAFRAYDYKKNGYLTTKELRSILVNTGETLTNKDVDMILREANVSRDDKVDYEHLVNMLSTPIADY